MSQRRPRPRHPLPCHPPPWRRTRTSATKQTVPKMNPSIVVSFRCVSMLIAGASARVPRVKIRKGGDRASPSLPIVLSRRRTGRILRPLAEEQNEPGFGEPRRDPRKPRLGSERLEQSERLPAVQVVVLDTAAPHRRHDEV